MLSCFLLDSFELQEMVCLTKNGATFSSLAISKRTYGGPQGTTANKRILVQTNICRCKQIYIDAKRIKHYVKLINVAVN